MKRTYHRDGSLPAQANAVFVFGSNEGGRHGAGAARVAHKQFGASWGASGARGPSGKAKLAYAIATKDAGIRHTLPLAQIEAQVEEFIEWARAHPDVPFFVTRIGCGLAGCRDQDIAPMFRRAPSNCSFADTWRPYLGDES